MRRTPPHSWAVCADTTASQRQTCSSSFVVHDGLLGFMSLRRINLKEFLCVIFIIRRFHPFLEATKALRVSRGIALVFLVPWHTRWGWGVSPTPRPPLPLGKTRYQCYRRLGGPRDHSGWEENLVPTGIRSRTVQPLVSRYTNRTTRPTIFIIHNIKCSINCRTIITMLQLSFYIFYIL